jgi:hypothetical protein
MRTAASTARIFAMSRLPFIMSDDRDHRGGAMQSQRARFSFPRCGTDSEK